ncbi:MAG TPA: zf-HC2 domain-containing protein [Pyrinomonadaceae bacterium]|nr:zf-HC2 domain-containing protein [Chloracidobacterium sp.]MBP9936727.1 zf-HC2 domain-containing protein [Pyrinomonadaceae bacterium]MBK9436548.1 zf-HC2 domain-containing protein [Chloracidobacterium sp.]MBK9767435.1 zf-HC2 domain-containing protein [Chloracidobacterium sp.]MBL0241528.1 zf-HC2 domain-containing protein [Chloracidobacterium sp.]
MSKHLSNTEIEGYVHRTLPPDELLRVDDHIITCPECRSAATDVVPVNQKALLDAFEHPEVDGHLSFDQRTAYVESRLDEVEREIADHHLVSCPTCHEQVSDLIVLRKELAALPMAATATLTFWEQVRNGISAFRIPVIAIPAAAMLIGGVLLLAWFITNRRPDDETARVGPPKTNVNIVTPPPNSDLPVEPENIQNMASDKAKTVVVLNDGNGRIEMDAAGKITGLDDTGFERTVAAAMSGNPIEVSPEVRKLGQSSGTLMGPGNSGVPFALVGPVGLIVETTQPKFRWKGIKDAETYRVEIFNENFTKVVSSPDVRSAEWTVNVPLRRGTVYRWQVTAVVNGEEVKSPVRPAPDAKFKVLDASNANRLAAARAKNSRSHLLLGILYAESGLLDDAIREFQILVQKNPDSPIARRLLEKVRSAR